MSAPPHPTVRVPGEARLRSALAHGHRALAGINTPELVIASADAVSVCSSPIAAAWILRCAARRGTARWRALGEPHARWLRSWLDAEEQEPTPTGRTHAEIAALAALCAWRRGAPGGDLIAAGERALQAVEAPASTAQPPDLLIAIEALHLGDHLGQPLPAVEERVRQALHANGLNIQLESRCGRSPFVMAAGLGRWLGPQVDDRRGPLRARTLWETCWRVQDATATALDAALALECLLTLGPGSAVPGWWPATETLVSSIIESQGDEGLWPALPLYYDDAARALGSIQVTSALCLEALEVWSSNPGPPDAAANLSWQQTHRTNPLRAVDGISPTYQRPGARLEEVLTPLAAHLPAALVSPDAFAAVRRTTRFFPGALTHGWGLESRLAEPNGRVDFLLCITDQANGRSILAQDAGAEALPAALTERWQWQRVRDLCRRWADPESVLHAAVGEVWLEFDDDDRVERPAPVPSVFVCLKDQPRWKMPSANAEVRTRIATYREIVAETLLALTGNGIPDGIARQLDRCFAAIPARAYPFALGAMLGRRTEAIRLCVKDMQPQKTPGYLADVGWPGPHDWAEEMIAALAAQVDRITVDLDVGEGILPTLGLECSFHDHRPPSVEPRWFSFMDFLVDQGLCLSAKRDAILAWPGKLHDLAPSDDGLLLERYFEKLLGHVKVGRKLDGTVEAKGYLGTWLVIERSVGRIPVPVRRGASSAADEETAVRDGPPNKAERRVDA